MEPIYVTFEQGKLIKEKGFDERTTVWRQHGNGISGDVEGKKDYYNRKGDVYTSLPEQWQVVEYFRLEYGIWISVFHKRHSENKHYGFVIKQANEIEIKLWGFSTPQNAYSAAFDYILKELI